VAREGIDLRAYSAIEPLPARNALCVRDLGLVDYATTWRAMQEFTSTRDASTGDEIWRLQHPPVYTLGLAGKTEHRLTENAIPLLKIDRGGQITYHGPGQLVLYLLLDLRRRGLGIRDLVRRIEESLLALLASYGITGQTRSGAPGVYVEGAKIAALGLRVRHGCCYHGLALNVAMDLAPFAAINPCGFPGLAVTQLSDLGIHDKIEAIGERLTACLASRLPAPRS
jgi:lipoyl(octanoyl) transferase